MRGLRERLNAISSAPARSAARAQDDCFVRETRVPLR